MEHAMTPAARDAALVRAALTGQRIGSAAIDAGASADRVAMALARQHGVLAALDHQLAAIAPSVRAAIPEEVMRGMCVVPLRLAAGTGELIVAVRDPDLAVMAELARITGRTVRVAVAAERRLRQAIDVVCGCAAADNPLLPRQTESRKPPPEAARLIAEIDTASASRGLAGRLSRRLVERALVAMLIVALVGSYAAHRRWGTVGAPASSKVVEEPVADPPGQLDRAFESYTARMARCRSNFEACVVECRRDAPDPREAHCNERCQRSACGSVQLRTGEPSAPPSQP
jgi:MshEN domain